MFRCYLQPKTEQVTDNYICSKTDTKVENVHWEFVYLLHNGDWMQYFFIIPAGIAETLLPETQKYPEILTSLPGSLNTASLHWEKDPGCSWSCDHQRQQFFHWDRVNE